MRGWWTAAVEQTTEPRSPARRGLGAGRHGTCGPRHAEAMRFTEHELTAALNGAAKSVLAARRRGIRRQKVDVDEAWEAMDRYQRFRLQEAIGDQILPVLVALPDVEVGPGTRPTFTDAQITAAVEDRLSREDGLDEQDGQRGQRGRLRRKAVLLSRVALVKVALASVPPRRDPDALLPPDDR